MKINEGYVVEGTVEIVGGKDTTNIARVIKTDTDGHLQIDVVTSVQPLTSTIHASAAETITGNSADIDASNYSLAVFYLNVSAFAGTNPTLDVTIEGKDPIAGTYYTIVTFIQKVATGSERITLAILSDRTIRGKWTIGGSAGQSFTFSLVGVLRS